MPPWFLLGHNPFFFFYFPLTNVSSFLSLALLGSVILYLYRGEQSSSVYSSVVLVKQNSKIAHLALNGRTATAFWVRWAEGAVFFHGAFCN